jgi:hypothetical protein
MREEPFCYIDSKSFCVKHRTNLFGNVELTGIGV